VLPTDREKCRASGMDDFLAKPIREGVVRMVIRRTLDRIQAEEQVQAA
jgi:CheY-like chemotaxis protein